MFTRDNLHRSLRNLGVTEPGDIFDRLKVEYTKSDRSYHSDTHVSECLKYLEAFSQLASRKDEIAVAIWFHDAIYDTRKSDNEELSAAWAVDFLEGASVAKDIIVRVEAMILATKTHVAETADENLMLDIDLGILGTPEDVFESYDASIREEYGWVPENEYRKGRTTVLMSFLEREVIYKTAEFRNGLEETARQNLRRKIDELST